MSARQTDRFPPEPDLTSLSVDAKRAARTVLIVVAIVSIAALVACLAGACAAAETVKSAATDATEGIAEIRTAVGKADQALGWVQEKQEQADAFLTWTWRFIIGFSVLGNLWQRRRTSRLSETLRAAAGTLERMPPTIRDAVKEAMEADYGGCPVVTGEIRRAKKRGRPPRVPGRGGRTA